MFAEFERFDAVGLADLVRHKQVTEREVMEAALARIGRYNPAVNAIVHMMSDTAERCLAAGLPDGPLRGVPFLLKDLNVLYDGAPTSNGSRLFRSFVADHDSHITERHRAAGLLIIGKTNTPEFGLSGTTEPVLHGPTRNPWNTALSSGGSSGGAAAAVACRMLPAAHATDGGGSIRIPASACGLFGLKPTRGRNPAGPDVGEGLSGMGTGHIVSISVRDSAAFLDATSGPAPGDPYATPPPARPYACEVGTDPGRLRIAASAAAPGGVPVHPECARAVAEAARLCAELGHEVEEAAPPFDLGAALESVQVIWAANVCVQVTNRYRALGRPVDGSDLERVTWALVQEGGRRDAAAYAAAVQRMHRIGRQFATFFATYDVSISPTLAMPPWPLGALDMMSESLEGYLTALFNRIPFTAQYNMTGQPAATVPLHWTADGVPVGVQFAARFGDEATLLRLAAQLEQAKPWAQRLPPLVGA